MKSEAEIVVELERSIPSELLEKYSHLTFSQMAEVEELEPWRDLLIKAEKHWNALEEGKRHSEH